MLTWAVLITARFMQYVFSASEITRKLSFLLCRVAILCLLLTTVVLCRLLWNGGTLINAFLSYAPVGRTYLIKAKEPTYFLRFILPIG